MKHLSAKISILLLVLSSACSTAELPRESVEYFEQHIRPLLVEKCYSCHSAKAEKIKGALLLDSREATLKGGATGPAVVPGDTGKSLLLKAVRYQDEKLQMPPDEKLSGQQVALLEAWIKMGAPDPRVESTSIIPSLSKAREFWTFKKVIAPTVPTLKNSDPALAPIDRFVRAKLDEKGLQASTQADKRTLIRRAAFDLTGLPPTPEEIEAFIADKTPDAFAKIVDRYLASPRYGERWGRYWLDVARYADTKGYVFEEERRYPYSYVYRDWVINAFNADLPYDDFLIKQIAADQLPKSEDNKDLAAMGFLLLGRRFLNNEADIIDDRLDVLMRGTQGLSINCARCHDHKFDAITQQDYYGLYAVLASSHEPKELPLVGKRLNTPEVEEYEKELKAKEADLDVARHKIHEKKLADLRGAKSITDYLMAVRELGDNPGDKLNKRDLLKVVYERWKKQLKSDAKPGHPIWGPLAELSAMNEADFTAKITERTKTYSANSDKKLNPLVAKLFEDKVPTTLREVADKYGTLLAGLAKPEVQADASAEALRLVTFATDAAVNIPYSELSGLMNRDDNNKEREFRKKIDALPVTHPGAPMRAMILNDKAAPVKQHVFLRGNPGNAGPEAPRKFIALLDPKHEPFKLGSGRLELARAIASKDNPLTARVMVNRIWMHHFGKGLIGTPSDFGVRSDAPANRELLDYLAVNFMQNGWSIKKLHREIMLSKTYQQSSSDNPAARLADPENVLVWRFSRQRLDFEALRDTLLYIAGALDEKMGGRALDMQAQPFSKRRTIYGYIDRQNLPGIFRAFDFANPDTHSPLRFTTTVPQQALYMMNSPFTVELAKTLAGRTEILSSKDNSEKIKKFYRLVFGRPATDDEIGLGLKFIEAVPREKSKESQLGQWEKYAQVLLESNEFVFVD